MNFITETVSIAVGGAKLTGWKRVDVRQSFRQAVVSFEVHTVAQRGAAASAAQLALFAPVSVYGNADAVCKGYIETRSPSFNANEETIAIHGSSKGADAVDCAAIHPTGRFEKQTPLEIAQALDKFGIGFSSDAEMQPIPEFHLTPGETLHRTIERLCRDQGLTLAGQPDGSIKLTNAAQAKRHAGGLVEGLNIQSGSASHGTSRRYSHVHVRGQAYDDHGPSSLELESIAQDANVPRYRPLIIVVNGNADKTRVKARAKHHRDRATGHGLRASVTVPGWRDDAGALWMPGKLAWTESAFLDIRQDMLIESVTRIQDESEGTGTLTQIELVDPRAYGGKSGGVNKSGGAWSADSSEAS